MNIHNVLTALDTIGFQIIRMLISLLWQSSLLIGMVVLVVFALRNRSTKIRHIIWVFLLCLLPVIPFLGWGVSVIGTPQVEIPVIPEYSSPMSVITNNQQQIQIPDNYELSDNQSVSVTIYPWAMAFLAYTIVVLFFLLLFVGANIRIQRWIRYGSVITDKRIIEPFRAARERAWYFTGICVNRTY